MDILAQISVCVPSIMTATTLIASAINSAFKIEKSAWKHAITWIIAVVAGILFKVTGVFNFGLINCWAGWEYFIAAGFGIIAGAASNGFYDWDAIKKIIDAFGQIFVKKTE